MSTTERERLRLYETLKKLLGPQDAGTLMGMWPQVDPRELATKNDLHVESALLRSEMVTEFAAVRTEFAAVRSEMATEFAAVRTEMAVMKTDLLRTLGTWLFASQAAVIVAVTMIVALLG